jgi:hypothetical protein
MNTTLAPSSADIIKCECCLMLILLVLLLLLLLLLQRRSPDGASRDVFPPACT